MIRTFLIYYPETGETVSQTVSVEPHETPEQAITREGAARLEWVLLGEFPTHSDDLMN